jgi:acyl carrier protein
MMGLDIVEMMMEIEKSFDIEIANADAEGLATVGQLFDHVRGMLDPRTAGDRGPYAGPVWERFLDVIEEKTGVERSRLIPTAHFVRDLKLDTWW